MIVDDLEGGARMFHSLCKRVLPTHLSFVFHGSVRRNNDMERNRQIGAVINGRITMGSLSFTYTPVFTV